MLAFGKTSLMPCSWYDCVISMYWKVWRQRNTTLASRR